MARAQANIVGEVWDREPLRMKPEVVQVPIPRTVISSRMRCKAALTKPPPIHLGLDHAAPTAAAHYASDESLAAVAD